MTAKRIPTILNLQARERISRDKSFGGSGIDTGMAGPALDSISFASPLCSFPLF